MATRKTPARDRKTGRFLSNFRKRKARKTTRPRARNRKPPARARTRRNPPRPPEMPQGTQDNLEADIVDRYSMGTVLDALASICFEKAAHLEENWGDPRSGVPWRRIGKRIGTVAAAAYGEGV